MILDNKIEEYLRDIEDHHLLRTRQLREEHTGLLHFDSNDYLSLAQEAQIAQAYQKGYSLYPSGSGASMLLSGYHEVHQELEQAFIQLLDVEDCLLFSSGYAANLAISQLASKIQAPCLIDKAVHASVYDGMNLSRNQATRFIHNDMGDLEKKLAEIESQSLVFTEGIFSMSGQIAPLAIMSDIGQKHRSSLIVDEAHSFGVLGTEGQGAVSYFGLSQEEVPLRTIAFGKSFASQGAVVVGKKKWIQALIQAARSFIYSTAISPALSYGLLETLNVIRGSEYRRQKLNQLIAYFKDHIKQSPFTWIDSDSPIQQLQLGSASLSLQYAKELQKKGIYCSAIRRPTVTAKATGLRIILNYKHRFEDIELLFHSLKELYEY